MGERLLKRVLRERLYYGWVVVAVVFLALLVSAGVRAAPAVYKPFRDGARVGPGGDLVRRLGWAPSLRALRPRCRMADGSLRSYQDYARRPRPYRRQHSGRRRDDRALAA